VSLFPEAQRPARQADLAAAKALVAEIEEEERRGTERA
jgi:hypothetical protein